MKREDLINNLRQGKPVTARLVREILKGLEDERCLRIVLRDSEQYRESLTRKHNELIAKNRELDQACRAMLAGDVEAYRMMRKALGES